MLDTRTFRWVTGTGDREPPPEMERVVLRLVAALAKRGYGVRTGNAVGMDAFFRAAAAASGAPIQVFHAGRHSPLAGAIGLMSRSDDVIARCKQYVYEMHPRGRRLKPEHLKQHAQHALKVLGPELAEPSRVIVCWAGQSTFKDARLFEVKGETREAVRIAHAEGIPAYNLAVPAHQNTLGQLLGLEGPVSRGTPFLTTSNWCTRRCGPSATAPRGTSPLTVICIEVQCAGIATTQLHHGRRWRERCGHR